MVTLVDVLMQPTNVCEYIASSPGLIFRPFLSLSLSEKNRPGDEASEYSTRLTMLRDSAHLFNAKTGW